MSRASSEEWSLYYEGSQRKRVARYLDRKESLEKRMFMIGTLLLVGVLVASYSILVR